MPTLEVFAHLTVRPGQLEGFKKQAAECIRITKEKDTRTLRYDETTVRPSGRNMTRLDEPI